MTKDEALKLAREALELEDMACRYEKESTPEHIAKAITAIKQALANVATNDTSQECVDKTSESVHEPEYLAFMDTPQRKPLTDEEIILIVADCASSHQHTDIHFARAIEAAHGIKE